MNIKVIRNRFKLLKSVRRLEAMIGILSKRNDFEFIVETAWGFPSPSKADLAYKSDPEIFFKDPLPTDLTVNGWISLIMDIRRIKKLREEETGGSPKKAENAKQQLLTAVRENQNG